MGGGGGEFIIHSLTLGIYEEGVTESIKVRERESNEPDNCQCITVIVDLHIPLQLVRKRACVEWSFVCIP